MKHCEKCHKGLGNDGFHSETPECDKQEIVGLRAQLSAYEKLAAKGIYYTLDELKEHDKEVELKALADIKKIAEQSLSTNDVRDIAVFFESVYWKFVNRQSN